MDPIEVEAASSGCRELSGNKKPTPVGVGLNGADYEARTRYLHLGKVALYQMS